MTGIENILKIASDEDFRRVACEVFRRQAACCEPYAEYLEAIGVTAREVEHITADGHIENIPFLPIEIFKTHRVYCGGTQPEPEAIFTSSSTGGAGASRHYVARLADYEQIFTRGFELFYGSPTGWSIYALLPSYLEREGSSLVYMARGLIDRGREAGRGGGFYLYDHTKLLADMASDNGRKILLGVSYALLDLAEEFAARGEKLPHGTIVMETGGMKGRREEMSKDTMHAVLCRDLGVTEVHSEYGMAELMSQAYSKGGGVFRTAPWMKVMVRDLADPFDVKSADGAEAGGEEDGRAGSVDMGCEADGGEARKKRAVRGGINIVDLGNLSSCAFIQTQDLGTLFPDGGFTIDGRVSGSDIRGCNLLIQ